MRATAKTSVPASANEDRKSKGDFDHRRLPDLLKRYFEGQNHLRKGICLLNAGAHKEAVRELSKASRLNPESKSLVYPPISSQRSWAAAI
ncbi:MAG: hypothetical protein GXP29_00290 [Planctomycetes bacterium]|nr:hypothetical protein [Planctomycetota bacterium]